MLPTVLELNNNINYDHCGYYIYNEYKCTLRGWVFVNFLINYDKTYEENDYIYHCYKDILNRDFIIYTKIIKGG